MKDSAVVLCITKLSVSWSSVTERVCGTKDINASSVKALPPGVLYAHENRRVTHGLQMLCSVVLRYESGTEMMNTKKRAGSL